MQTPRLHTYYKFARSVVGVGEALPHEPDDKEDNRAECKVHSYTIYTIILLLQNQISYIIHCRVVHAYQLLCRRITYALAHTPGRVYPRACAHLFVSVV